MDLTTARELAENTIQFEIRHADYEHCREIARLSKIFLTGEGQDTEYLVTLRDKETDRQKAIRVKVTKPITPLALNPVKTEYMKMFRVDGVTSNIEGKDLTMLTEALETYHANGNLDNYLERRYVRWNFLDPNGWVITERRNVVDDMGKVLKVDVYPLEVTSEQAINYQYDNGVPQWLMVRQERIEVVTDSNGDAKAMDLGDFYFYAPGIALRYAEYMQTPPEVPNGTEISLMVGSKDEPSKFVFAAYMTGTKEFPGQKWGAYDEQDGNGTVKVPPYWDGSRYLLEDLIETKSVFDVSKHNHVFPKLFVFAQPCGHVENGVKCSDGYLGGNHEALCPSCRGSGNSQLHFGESDIIEFNMPKNMEDFKTMPGLPELAYYHNPPLDVTTALYEWVQQFKSEVYIASFNSTNVDKALVAKTATEVSKLWDDINTRIYPCAVWLSRLYEKAVRITAQYLEKDDVTVRHSFPKDMKLEPLDVLIARYKEADGLPYEIRQSIMLGILGKTYLDNPKRADNIKAWEYWKPFKSMQPETVLFILQSRDNQDFDKMLFENWDNVQIEVERAIGERDFSELPESAQYEQIRKAVEKVGAAVKYVQSEPQFPDFSQLMADKQGVENNSLQP